MKITSSLILLFALGIAGCGDDHPKNGSLAGSGHHQHVAPHGGTLLEVGPHGSGFNLELLIQSDGFLHIYILDAHADNFVRIAAETIEVEVLDPNQSSPKIICKAVADRGTGETVGDSSLFTSTETITGFLPLRAKIQALPIKNQVYEDIVFELPGNSIQTEE
jgi:hypothetical protein